MIPKLLFVDFDGVLHPASAPAGARFSRVDLLAAVWPTAGCDMVISSSWRNAFPLATLIRYFPPALRPSVIGATGEPHRGPFPRYEEIKTYLRRHRPLADWRALDDSWIEFPKQCPELIRCDPNHGLQEPQVRCLQTWLSG